jgi:3-deoxy-manno-octulosonate cytidylyltransferase (CMP-KDO synthetase)
VSFNVLIPARYNSIRLPGKPLADLSGKTIIRRVYEAALKSNAKLVCVATDSSEILEECYSFNGRGVLTSFDHKTGSDRLAEAASILSLADDDVVVNLQGDEPFVDFRDINNIADLLNDKTIDMATLYADLKVEDVINPNVVKIWTRANDQVINFSRKEDKVSDVKFTRSQHLGIYAYRVKFLKEFINWKQTDNEKMESLEQLRALERGKNIYAKKSIAKIHLGIDTPEDLHLAQKLLEND